MAFDMWSKVARVPLPHQGGGYPTLGGEGEGEQQLATWDYM